MNSQGRFYSRLHGLAATVLLATLMMSGCMSVSTLNSKYDTTFGKKQKVTNVYESGGISEHLRRVAILPLYKGSYDHIDMTLIEENFVQELNKRRVFEVVPIGAEELLELYGVYSFSSVEVLPTKLLGTLHDLYAIDGIIFVDLTYYKAYQPVAMGVRAKLLDGHTGNIVWSADESFDASSPAVSNAARRYFQKQSINQYPLQNTQTALHSSARFSKYVAHALFQTLKTGD